MKLQKQLDSKKAFFPPSLIMANFLVPESIFCSAGSSNELRAGGGKPLKNSRNARSPARSSSLCIREAPTWSCLPFRFSRPTEKTLEQGPFQTCAKRRERALRWDRTHCTVVGVGRKGNNGSLAVAFPETERALGKIEKKTGVRWKRFFCLSEVS